jgi:hypothetical protein
MPTLEILCGMIGSGKSTYARRRADEGALVVCHDDLSTMLHARPRYEQGLRACYRKMEESLAWAALNAGRDVIVDRTHLTAESRRRWVRWAADYDAMNTFEGRGPKTPVFAIDFPIGPPGEHARRRYLADPRGRPFHEWYKVACHHREQADAEPLSESEGFARIITVPSWPSGANS